MRKIIFGAIAALALMAGSEANAQTRTPVITHRQVYQHQRIQQGVRNGSLTHAEARHLRYRESKIRYDKRMARRDGVVTPYERRRIRMEQNRASYAIYRQKHDGQRRW